MNYNKLPLLLLGSLLVGDSAHLRAEDTSWSDTDRFDLSYRMGFNISTKFRNIGTPALANNPSVTGLSYQNGFVSADNTGNAGGLTTFYLSYRMGFNISTKFRNIGTPALANN